MSSTEGREGDVSLAAALARVTALEADVERARCENENLIESLKVVEESRDHYAWLYDNAPVGWLTLDAHGLIRKRNIRFAKLLGFEQRDITGTPLKGLIVPHDRRLFLEHLAQWTFGRDPAACEVRLLCQDGIVPVRLESSPPDEPGGTHAVAVFDLRERDRLEQERQRLLDGERSARQANEAKDQFIAMLSHELRTPLTPVLVAVSALVESRAIPSELRGTFAMLKRNVSAEARLIDDLLDATRISRGKMLLERTTTDLHRIVKETSESLRSALRDKQQVLSFQLTADPSTVNGDPGRLRQVIANLLDNAHKFTGAGGHIEIRSWNRAERVVVEISDSGRGIAPDALSRLFVPFEQLAGEVGPSQSGLGLGLAICRGIVELHGGRIVAASRGHGLGARFVVELDATEATEEPLDELKPPRRRPSTLRIVLVEDHDDTANLLSSFLRDAGYEVHVAHSIEDALAFDIHRHDLVVSDLGLPDGSGHDLMRRLRERVDVKAIALSGYGTEADKRASRDAGFSVHLTKPVEFERLLATIAQVVGA